MNRALRHTPHHCDVQQQLCNAYLDHSIQYVEQTVRVFANQLSTDPGSAWQVLQPLLSTPSIKPRVTGETPQERVNAFHAHFTKLFAAPPPTPALPQVQLPSGLQFKTGPFSLNELIRAQSALCNRKSPGMDKIPNEILKLPEMQGLLLKCCNTLLTEGKLPDGFLTSLLVTLPKKGDLSLATNYRGIALMQTISKLYDRLLLHRLRKVMNTHLRPQQNGFRPGRSTQQHVMCLRTLIDAAEAHQDYPLVGVFVDFSKAFDSVSWAALRAILEKWGVPAELITAIFSVMEGHKIIIKTDDGLSEPISVQAGVLQGDTLAPFLFVVALDYVLRASISDKDGVPLVAHSTSSRVTRSSVGARTIPDLDFADDIVLLCPTLHQARVTLHRLEAAALTIGLKINSGKDKTEFFTIGTVRDDEALFSLTLSDGRPVPKVDQYKYLGCNVLRSHADLNTRIGLGWKALVSLRGIWRSQLSADLKDYLFQTLIQSVYSYGAVAWPLTATQRLRLCGATTRMLRYVRGVGYTEHVTLANLYRSIPQATTMLAQRRLRLVGHTLRSEEKHPLKLTLGWRPTWCKRKVGGPKLSLNDAILTDAGFDRSSGWPQVKEIAQNREAWSRTVHQATKTHQEARGVPTTMLNKNYR